MKFKAKKLDAKKLMNGNTELTFEIEDKNNALIGQIYGQKQFLESELEVGIEKYRKKRSSGHNRLFWDMCGELAKHINDPTITQYTIYREIIKEYGESVISPIKDDMLDMVIRAWEGKGDGWLTQKLQKSKLEGDYTNVKFWFGSSIYNSKQFWRVVEGLKLMCADHNLDISCYDQPMQEAIKEMERKESIQKENSHGNN